MARRSAATTYALSALAILIFLVYTFTGDGDKERPIPVPPARNTKGLNDRGVLQSLTFNEGVAARNARPSAVQLDAAHGPPIAVNRNDDHPRIPPPPPPPRAPLREGTPTREYPPALAKARLPKEPVARIPDSPPIHLPLPPVKLNPAVEETDDALRKAGQNVPKERVSDDDQIEGLVEKVESRPPVFDIAEPVEAVVPPLKEFMGKKLSPVVPPAGPRVDLKKGKWDGGWSQRFKQKVTDEAAAQPAVAISGVLAHPLVARIAAHDFTVLGLSPQLPLSASTKITESEDDDEDEDSFETTKPIPKSTGNKSSTKYNLTLCALIPSEQRFLPEWLVYHRLLGVERFALYDTSASGAAGSAELDAGADVLAAAGRGETKFSAQEIKAGLGGGIGGLDEKGRVWTERIVGLEKWIEQGVVVLHYMRFKDTKSAQTFHQQMIRHCTDTFSPTTNWLAHLDVDEFITQSPTLYGPSAPYSPSASSSTADAPTTATIKDWQYPLHDLLARPTNVDSACIPIPGAFKYRNVGVRTLAEGQGVLDTQTARDVVHHGTLPEKVLIHPAFGSSFVEFSGPHSCRVNEKPAPEGVSREIRNSQGVKIQDGGTYQTTRLPTEPLAIAHYLQRDLSDCHQKLGNLNDPNSIYTDGQGQVLCDEHYLPSSAEMSSPAFLTSPQNRFLARIPPEGMVVEDLRMKQSWTAEATKAILDVWRESAVGGGASGGEVERARDKVVMLVF